MLYSQSEVEIYHRYERIAVHKRDRQPYGYTTINDHLASQHRFMSDWNPDNFIKRAEEIGQQTKEYMEIIEDRHGNRSTIITSQLPVAEWYEVIGEQTIADAILDRVVHDAHRMELAGYDNSCIMQTFK